jgi:DNA-binding transcriptional LysR family regulator
MNGVFNSETISVFLAVLDNGSFSAAARQLGRVPSAISMAIANLEAELALELFDRSGREPKPTAMARALEPQARLLISQLQQLNTQALELSQGLEARLTLAIAPELQATPWVAHIGAGISAAGDPDYHRTANRCFAITPQRQRPTRTGL